MWKPPGLTVILVPDSNIRAVETPSYHNHQRQVGVCWVWTIFISVCVGAPTYLKYSILMAEFLVSSDVGTPWLDSHPGFLLPSISLGQGLSQQYLHLYTVFS